jgi:mannose-6-phosphate isomerase-like protein (cupin superfamily)
MSDAQLAKPRLTKLSYVKPDYPGERAIVILGGTDIQSAAVQLMRVGARQKLHAHANYDGLYLVLEGRVRFSGADGFSTEAGPKESVVVPRGAAYGFEAVDGDAEMYFVGATDPQTPSKFTAHEAGADVPNYDFYDPAGQPRHWSR